MQNKIEKKLNFPSDLIWEESIKAIKNPTTFQNLENYKKHLIEKLPQNSIETRDRYASNIMRRYFSDNRIISLCSLVWKYYQDEKILKDVMRFQFMQKENLVEYFFLNYLFTLNTDKITSDIFKKFSIDKYGEVKSKLVKQRLPGIIKGMEYVYFDKKNMIYTLLKPDAPKTAFLILLHYLFSQQPQTTTVAEIIENNFWKYLRIYSPHTVREILKEANANDILIKYIIADELEQVTTKYSFEEFLEKKIKL